MKVHLRATDWYEAHGSGAMAVEHLLNTNERDRCVQLVTSLLAPTYFNGQVSTVTRWLETLGDDAIQAYPPLLVMAGWMAALGGHEVETERLSALLEAASFDQVPVDGTASFESARAMLLSIVCPAGAVKAAADAELALAAEPVWSAWRDQALCMAGEAAFLLGDVARGRELFGDVYALGLDSDAAVLARAEPGARHGPGPLGGGGRARGRRPRAHRADPHAGLQHQRPRLRGRRPPRRCTGATTREPSVIWSRRCGPGWRAPPRCPPWRCGCACTWPGCTCPWVTRPRRDTCCARSTTCAGYDQIWGCSSVR